ncbi:hypothetical protein [Opitutus terrae]|uniref:Uncharacterized protein n=1 Tax=Opitutus terrae (strain DSM 11246 / JCM 15787 / PB90-1) TaxID=452637 RepID=B1ZM91_OPITP|nr:hypothetical protein [Opitutus terrae]ACB73344.1 hypothetical protein Oter_0053 [Opitutus terrae PB90-1]
MTLPPSLKPVVDFLAGYPDWVVAAVLTVVAVLVLWILAKVLKWSLYLLMALVLIGGAIGTVWLLLEWLRPAAGS